MVIETAIKTGIHYIVVAKLEEAVLIRNSGILGAKNIHIMVFETPLQQDISAYVHNHIEMILPFGPSITVNIPAHIPRIKTAT